MSTDDDVRHIDELPIALRFSNAALDMGFTPIPRLFLWFFSYLRGPQNETLDPREAFFLEYIIAEKEGPDNPVFRLSQLPCPFSDGTRRRYASKIRAMGLIYSKAQYVATPHQVGVGYKHPPTTRIQSIEWIMDPLFYSLSLVHAEWQKRRELLKVQTGKLRVFYRLPDDYVQAVAIPPFLIEPVALEQFYRLNPFLVRQARELLAQRKAGTTEALVQPPLLNLEEGTQTEIPSRADLSSHGIRDARNPRVTEIPSRADYARVLVEDSTTTTTTTRDTVNINSQIAKFFAEAIGAERYELTEKEQRRLVMLLAKGYSADDICQTIMRLVERERAHGKNVHALAYCLSAVVDSSVERGPVEPAVVSGTPQPPVVRETPPAEARTVTSAPTLDELANGDAELRDLLDMIQAKNPTRVLDRADARAWKTLADDFAAFAKSRDTSPVGVVLQAVLEAISANSNRDGFLAPNLARRILERWQTEADAARKRAEEPRAERDQRPRARAPNAPQVVATVPMDTDELRDLWTRVLDAMRDRVDADTLAWLGTTRAIACSDGTLQVQVETDAQAVWLREHLHGELRRALDEIADEQMQIEYATRDPNTSVPDAQTLSGERLMNVSDLWHATLGELQLQMTRATFDTWVRPSRALGWENRNGNGQSEPTLIVGVHSLYAREWLENRLNTTIQRTVTGIVGRSVEIRYLAPTAVHA